MLLIYEWHEPNSDFENAVEEVSGGGDELADAEDELLLQHGLADVVRQALAVDEALQLVRADRLVQHLLLVSKHSHGDLTSKTNIAGKKQHSHGDLTSNTPTVIWQATHPQWSDKQHKHRW